MLWKRNNQRKSTWKNSKIVLQDNERLSPRNQIFNKWPRWEIFFKTKMRSRGTTYVSQSQLGRVSDKKNKGNREVKLSKRK